MRYLLLALALLASVSLGAQTLKGTIVNEEGEPVPYAVIFIKELAQGTSANKNGVFELRIKAGTYTCSFQSLGHQTVEKKVTVGASGAQVAVTLPQQPYQLMEAEVGTGAGKEDPAYRIMRKVIGMAPYHLYQVNEYKSNVYLKGTLTVNKISGLVKALAGKELEETGIKVGDEYMQESVNEVHFTAPDKFEQNVVSVSGTFPKGTGDFYFVQMRFNIYDPDIDLFVSPLSPSAFSSYKFVYEGTSLEGMRLINKIKVVPKQKGLLTVEGYLYIDEDTWSVKEFDLSGKTMGGEYRNRQSFAEVEKDVFLPISYLFDQTITLLGNEAELTYKSVVKYEEVKVNPQAYQQAEGVAAKAEGQDTIPVSARKQKLDSQIEQLLLKNSLSNRDAIKLADLMSKSAKEGQRLQADPGEQKDPLLIERNLKLKVDSLAKKRDTTYWELARPVPLSDAEVRSYELKDSTMRTRAADTLGGKSGLNDFGFSSILMGDSYYYCDTTLRFSHGGLMDMLEVQFSPVDGFSTGTHVELAKRFKDTTVFSARADARYAFERQVLNATLKLGYSYLPERRAKVELEGGRTSSDFSKYTGVSSILVPTFHKNYINFYDRRFVELRNTIDIANGLEFKLSASVNDRRQLHNNTEYAFFYRKSRQYRSNDPQNPDVIANPALITDSKAAIIEAELSYTPRYYYRMQGRRKEMVRSAYPTFTVGWKKGIPDILNSDVDYDLGTVSVKQTVDLGLMKSLKYEVGAGYFFNKKSLYFADYHHFNIREPELLFFPFTNGMYYLPQTYESSTAKWFATAATTYTTPYLLIKRLPFIRDTYWQENLHLSYLRTPDIKNYMEAGYSITGIGLLLGVGVFVGFEDFQYKNVGFTITIAGF